MTQLKKIKIALVVPALVDGGGIPTYAHFLYEQIQKDGRYEPDLISLPSSMRDAASTRLLSPRSWFRGPAVTTGVWRGAPYRHVGARMIEIEFQRYRPRKVLSDLLHEYDLVQVVAGAPVWSLAVRGCGKPLCLAVATLTEVERHSRLAGEHGLKKLWLMLMTRLIGFMDANALGKVDAAFVINHWMEQHLASLIGPARVIFAPPGVDTDFFYPASYNPNGCILSVGRLSDPRKNVRLLFAAYAKLLHLNPNAPPLVLAGKTLPGPADMAYAEELGIYEHLEFHANVSQEDLRTLYQGAALYVLSSDEEGLGIVLLEAMACGLPVVATRCGGPQTVVSDGETGLLTPVGDAQALAWAMGELLDNPERRCEMGELARTVTERSYSLAVAFQPYLDIYNRLTGSSDP